MTVSRETLALSERYALANGSPGRFDALIEALGREPDPHSTVADPVRDHVADSLSALVLPALAAPGTIADIGAGAGFPGLVLAVARPAAAVRLIEANGRKCAVIERLAAAAGLENVEVIHARAEECAPAAHDVVTARAVAPLAVLAEYAAPLMRKGGVLVAWKGARDPAEERDAAAAAALLGLGGWDVVRADPFAGARDRHLHVVAKVAATPERFPRRPGMARKRPLS